MSEILDVPPRYGTQRDPSRPTRGPEVEAASLLISRKAFLPWQRHVIDVAHELDPDTGLLWYETVVLVVPRQQGKSTALEAVLTAAALRREDVDVIYAAQDRQMSKRRLIDELADKRLARRPEIQGLYRVRRSNGSESIRWANGSAISTVANTDEAGHGLTLDLACLDEAFAHDDLTMITALEPTTITRPDPQVWIVSTVGDGTDGLLLHYQDIGQTALSDPSTRVAYFEWSADDDDDRDDPAVWARVMPALGHTIDPSRVATRRASLTPDVFDRSYLCRRPHVGMSAKLPRDAWDAGRGEIHELEAPLVAAVDVNADRDATTIAVAGSVGDRVGVLVDTVPSVGGAAVDAIAQLVHERGPVAVVADRRAGAGSLIDRLQLRGLPVDELKAPQLVTYCGSFYDAVTEGNLVHAGQPTLDVAARNAVSRTLGDAWAWDRRQSPADISAIVAASNAVGARISLVGHGSAIGIY